MSRRRNIESLFGSSWIKNLDFRELGIGLAFKNLFELSISLVVVGVCLMHQQGYSGFCFGRIKYTP